MASSERRKADPSISVAELEDALETYFEIAGLRNMTPLVRKLQESGIGWSTAAKVAPPMTAGSN